MSTGEPEAKRDEVKPRERRRLKLIESYGAFSDDRLQEVAQKIRGITSHNDPQLATLQGDAPLSSGEITESITQWITQCPLGEIEGVKEKQSFENAELISTNRQISTPNESPNDSPDRSSDGSSNESSDGSSNESSDGSSNRSPDGSPNESPLQLQLLAPSSADAGVLLTENQAMLYFCLKEINGKVTSLPQIARETHISEYTLKSCLKKLRQEGLIRYDGRRNCGGRIGFTATVLSQKIMLQGNKNRLLRKLQQLTQQALVFTESLAAPEDSAAAQTEANHPVNHLMDHPMDHPVDHPMDHQKRREAPAFMPGMDRRWARRAQCPRAQQDLRSTRALNGRGHCIGGSPGIHAGEDVPQLHQAIQTYKDTHPEEDFALLHHHQQTLLRRLQALFFAARFGIKTLTGFDTHAPPLPTLVGRGYHSSTLLQCLGQLERVAAAPALLPTLVPVQPGPITSVDGPMIAYGSRWSMHKGKSTMLGRIRGGSQAVSAHDTAGYAVFVPYDPPALQLSQLIVADGQKVAVAPGNALFVIDRAVNAVALAQAFDTQGLG